MDTITSLDGLTPGAYAVHNKYDPSFFDTYNYCYEIVGTVEIASLDEKIAVAYRPLYTSVTGVEHKHRADFLHAVRLADEFFGTIEKNGEVRPRFKVFRSKDELEKFLETSREQSALGQYIW